MSVLEEPVSDAAARSGEPGEGAVRSMVSVEPSAAVPGPLTPPDEVTDVAASRGISVPSEQPTAVTVNVAVVPLVGDGVNEQPVAVPALVKSLEATVVASTVLLNASV